MGSQKSLERSFEKMRKVLLGIALTVLIGLMPGSWVSAQDFEKGYAIGAGGYIRIKNISGDIKVSGYPGDTIIVKAFKQGRDRDLVKIEDNSSGDRVDVGVRYPDMGNCNASVNFEVRVPAMVNYIFESISSVSGDIEMDDVTGQIRAKSVSGDVEVTRVDGTVSATTVSGDVHVEIEALEGSGDMKFSSVSGSVYVNAPSELDAYVEMSTVSGSLKTDFPIEVKKRRYGPAGLRSLSITTVSGRVSLIRR
jgi:DUF4097 and DUF4098 domain-containing protein YvlB